MLFETIRRIENVQSIRIRKKNEKIDVDLIKKSGETFPALNYSPIYIEGKAEIDAERGLILLGNATCEIQSSPFGLIMTCRTD